MIILVFSRSTDCNQCHHKVCLFSLNGRGHCARVFQWGIQGPHKFREVLLTELNTVHGKAMLTIIKSKKRKLKPIVANPRTKVLEKNRKLIINKMSKIGERKKELVFVIV